MFSKNTEKGAMELGGSGCGEIWEVEEKLYQIYDIKIFIFSNNNKTIH